MLEHELEVQTRKFHSGRRFGFGLGRKETILDTYIEIPEGSYFLGFLLSNAKAFERLGRGKRVLEIQTSGTDGSIFIDQNREMVYPTEDGVYVPNGWYITEEECSREIETGKPFVLRASFSTLPSGPQETFGIPASAVMQISLSPIKGFILHNEPSNLSSH